MRPRARRHARLLQQSRSDRAAIDADGWLHTGDLAVRLPSGYYRITGRIKDMVIRGGENIYPREIEEFLFTHPAVEQAAVVGVPDPKYVEEVLRLDQAQARAPPRRRRKSATSAAADWPTSKCRATCNSSTAFRRP